MITSMTVTGEVRHYKTSTLITRKARTNKRVNRGAAVILIPRIMSTIRVPIVTTKKVTSKEKVTTTFVLKTRNIRVKAHFIIARRTRIRRGCGRYVLGTESVSSHIAKESANRPIHTLHGGVAGRCLRGRRTKTAFRRLRRLALKKLEETIISKSIRDKDIVTKRVTNVVGRGLAYRRIVRGLISRASRLVKKGKFCRWSHVCFPKAKHARNQGKGEFL